MKPAFFIFRTLPGWILALGLPLFLGGCLKVTTHSTIDPIYMTLDVNLKVQLQKELTDFFGEIDAASSTIAQ